MDNFVKKTLVGFILIPAFAFIAGLEADAKIPDAGETAGKTSASFEKLVKISNPAPVDRSGAVVEIPLKRLGVKGDAITAIDGNGAPLITQVTSDGLLLIEVSVPALETVEVKITDGEPLAADTVCLSQIRHDLQDDLAWENNLGGYRLYGPSYRNGGGNVAGYDIWTKSVEFPVLAQRYDDNCKYGISYHNDHGNGMDAYTVGKTLGAGMNALMDGNELIYPCAYERCEILDNGPLRTRAHVTCYPLQMPDGSEIIEERMITLDKNSWLNKTEVCFNGLKGKWPMATGIVVHKENPNGYVADPEKRYVAYPDLTDNPDKGNGVVYIGVVNVDTPDAVGYEAFAEPVGVALGHVMNKTQYDSARPYVYYWGSGWSKGGVTGMKAWMDYLAQFHECLKMPLVVSF